MAIGWLRLVTLTMPLLAIFFVMAAVQESAAWILGTLGAGGKARHTLPLAGASARPAGSVIFVPAEVWARPDVAVRQDEEAAVNGG